MRFKQGEYKKAAYRLADYSLWPDFSTLASVTLLELAKVSMFGSHFGVLSWLKKIFFLVLP